MSQTGHRRVVEAREPHRDLALVHAAVGVGDRIVEGVVDGLAEGEPVEVAARIVGHLAAGKGDVGAPRAPGIDADDPQGAAVDAVGLEVVGQQATGGNGDGAVFAGHQRLSGSAVGD